MVWGFWVNPTSRVPHRLKWNVDRARNYVLGSINNKGFDKQIFAVAATGFLTDSYALFATNIILPSLAYIYWPDKTNNRPELIVNCVTLAGSVCGQVLFGFYADRYGRRKLYGVELVIVIFGTLGMAQVSTGANGSMSVMGWIVFWRFFVGLGIGAEYPLSSVITAEFASTEYRATMMASVFLMQPIGQFLAATVGWAALSGFFHHYKLQNLPINGNDLTSDEKFRVIATIDSVWRCVVAVGAIPALIALIFRLSIPESPRYTMDVANDGMGAFYDIRGHYNLETLEQNAVDEIGEVDPIPPPPEEDVAPDPPTEDEISIDAPVVDDTSNDRINETPIPTSCQASENSFGKGSKDAARRQRYSQDGTPNHFTYEKLYEYFIEERNILWLVATSACWFLLDFAFFGLAIDNPRRIAAIWDSSPPNSTNFQNSTENWPSNLSTGSNSTTYQTAAIPDWENPFDVNTNIYQELYGDTERYVVTITIGSLVGSILMIALINRLPRKGWLVFSFLLLSFFFLLMGATLGAVEFGPSHWVTVAFYIICQFLFNFGPNTLTFIIPAEIFPTRYRATCHGISAAFGKLGSLIVQALLFDHRFTQDPKSVRIVLGFFTIPMALGALIAWIWLPSLQETKKPVSRACEIPLRPNKTLETLAQGRVYATGPLDFYPPQEGEKGKRLRGGGEVLGFGKKLIGVNRRFGKWRNGGFDSPAAIQAQEGDMEMHRQVPSNMEETLGIINGKDK